MTRHNKKLLGGISGCDVVLGKDGIVTKTTDSKSYEKRLRSQGNKQSLFSKFILKNIDTPRVLSVGDNFIKMEYIEAQSFDNFLNSSTRKDIEFISESLCDYISFLKERAKPSNKRITTLIKKKVKSLQNKTKHKYVIDHLLQKVEEIDVTGIPYSFCHGDLTFANILFHKNRLYFIDFLDTFINSYLLDLVKLKQDLFYKWSTKLKGVDDIRISQTKRYIWKRICENNKEIVDSEWFNFFDILNILRIEPYLQNEHQRNIFEDTIKGTVYYENINSADGRKI
ncbi:MAG: phosphotransferase [Proteobacteria bacterium]|nr:phosphotransferase [Pseudomonadota bacterium]